MPAGFTGTRIGVCNLCEAICGIELTITDGAVTGIRGNEADPLSRGYICPKGVSMADVYADPDRLRRPLRRVGEGDDATWEELGWDEAYDLVAERLAATITEHGANAVGMYVGNPNVHSLGFLTHGVPFMKTLRTRNKFSATSVDQLPHQFVAWQLYGHQLMLPDPGHRPHRLLPGPRRQPDGFQRLADDRARLPAAAARPQGPGRPAGRARPATHRDREGGHRAPLRAARLRRRRAARDAARAVRGGAHLSPGVRRPRGRGARPGRRASPPSAPSWPAGSPPTRSGS